MDTELTDWQSKKLLRLFDLFDNDGDEIVDEAEFQGALERLQFASGWPESSRVLSHTTGRWKVFSKQLFQNSPLLTSEKWLETSRIFLAKDRQARASENTHRGTLEELAQLLFLLLDRDRNSLIDYSEFLLFYYAIGLKDQDAESSFEKFDTDRDGSISKTEMEDMILEFFHGAEPGRHGDWLFGPPPKG